MLQAIPVNPMLTAPEKIIAAFQGTLMLVTRMAKRVLAEVLIIVVVKDNKQSQDFYPGFITGAKSMKKSTCYWLAGLLFIPLAVIADDYAVDAKGVVYTYPVTIDGRQYTFVLDIAESHSTIDAHLAKKLQHLATKNIPDKTSD